MRDPVAGLREMARVTRPEGVVAACVWDHGSSGPLTTFWRAARDIDPTVRDEGDLPGTREGHLGDLCREAGLRRVESTKLTVRVRFDTFAEWWEPFTFGVGPAGAHIASLDGPPRAALRDRCAEFLPPEPFEIAASAWAVRAQQ